MGIVTRMRMDPRTRAYVERRTAEGRTLREIRRCLKRYPAREDLPTPQPEPCPRRLDGHRKLNGRLERL